jgi:anti-anti-sigma factor
MAKVETEKARNQYQPGRAIKMSVVYHELATGVQLVNLSGALNVRQADDVVQLFRDLSEQGIKRVVVNLEEVSFIDSRGLAALIAGYRIFGSDAQNFRLAGAQDQPRLVFELTGFDHVFQIFAGAAEAIAARPSSQAQPGWGSPGFVLQLAVQDLAA